VARRAEVTTASTEGAIAPVAWQDPCHPIPHTCDGCGRGPQRWLRRHHRRRDPGLGARRAEGTTCDAAAALELCRRPSRISDHRDRWFCRRRARGRNHQRREAKRVLFFPRGPPSALVWSLKTAETAVIAGIGSCAPRRRSAGVGGHRPQSETRMLPPAPRGWGSRLQTAPQRSFAQIAPP